jgi:small-conductance mechanosensitive channel
MESFAESLVSLLSQYSIRLSLSLLILVLYFVLHGKVIPKLETYVSKGELQNNALSKAINIFRLLYGVISLALLLFIWGFDFKWLLAVSSGIIALTGVAMFASWSILSNITAFFILLAHQSYKRGNFIRVLDADNYIEGTISEINLFTTLLITENREYIVYPNNLLIARPTIINPKNRFSMVGKTQEFCAGSEATHKSGSLP